MYSKFYKDYPEIYNTREEHMMDFNKFFKELNSYIYRIVSVKYSSSGDYNEALSIMHSQLWASVAFSKKDNPDKSYKHRLNCCRKQLPKLLNEVYVHCMKAKMRLPRILDIAMGYSYYNRDYSKTIEDNITSLQLGNIDICSNRSEVEDIFLIEAILDNLDDREARVFNYMVEYGLGNSDIAERIEVSVDTIERINARIRKVIIKEIEGVQ